MDRASYRALRLFVAWALCTSVLLAVRTFSEQQDFFGSELEALFKVTLPAVLFFAGQLFGAFGAVLAMVGLRRNRIGGGSRLVGALALGVMAGMVTLLAPLTRDLS